jgi:cysteine desulfurase
VLLQGGGQEKGARAGTENVAGIAGFGAAAKYAKENIAHYNQLALWRDDMEARLSAITPALIFHGQDVPRVGNTSFFSLPGVNAQTLLMAFDLEGIALSNGSACSSGTVKSSVTLKAMGYSEHISACALRVSMGWASVKSDIDALVQAWEKIVARLEK